MCLIIDANVAGQLFAEGDVRTAFAPVLRALIGGDAKAVYGGKLTDEYRRLATFWRYLAALDRAGLARQLPREAVLAETERLESERRCRSNDHHVIAIARVGRVRLLCSYGTTLHEDFKDKALLDDPRGSIYQDPSQAHLIREHCAAR
jgi:hypothetical protein